MQINTAAATFPTTYAAPATPTAGIDALRQKADAFHKAEANLTAVLTGRGTRRATYSLERDLLARHTSQHAAGIAKASRNLDVAAAADAAVRSADDALITMRTAVERLAGGLSQNDADNARAQINAAMNELTKSSAAEFAGKRLFTGKPIASVVGEDVEASMPEPTQPNTGTGLTVSYYEGLNFEKLISTGVDATVHHAWRSAEVGDSGLKDNVSVRWEGEVEALEAGDYQFRTRSDDGIRVWVDDELVIDNWTNHGATYDVSESIAFEENERKSIRVEYFENRGSAIMQLQWGQNSRFRAINTGQLYEVEKEIEPGSVGVASNHLEHARDDFNAGPSIAGGRHTFYAGGLEAGDLGVGDQRLTDLDTLLDNGRYEEALGVIDASREQVRLQQVAVDAFARGARATMGVSEKALLRSERAATRMNDISAALTESENARAALIDQARSQANRLAETFAATRPGTLVGTALSVRV